MPAFAHRLLAPDELAADLLLAVWPDGTPVAGMAVCCCGAVAEGERMMRPLREFGPPLLYMVGPAPYTAIQKMIDAFYPSGLQNYWKSSFLQEVTEEAMDTMIARCTNLHSPMCHGLLEFQLGGAVSRLDPGATAFNHRDAQYSFMSLGVCTDQANTSGCIQWARQFWDAMQTFSTGGVYVNYLGREADEGVERIRAAYGPEKYARLVALKNKYDPTNLFRVNQNITPDRATVA